MAICQAQFAKRNIVLGSRHAHAESVSYIFVQWFVMWMPLLWQRDYLIEKIKKIKKTKTALCLAVVS